MARTRTTRTAQTQTDECLILETDDTGLADDLIKSLENKFPKTKFYLERARQGWELGAVLGRGDPDPEVLKAYADGWLDRDELEEDEGDEPEIIEEEPRGGRARRR